MRDSREFQVLVGEVKNVRYSTATGECVFEIAGAKFNVKSLKERLAPRENDRLAVACDWQNEVWNFKNLTSGKWRKDYSWRAHLMIFDETAMMLLGGKTMGFMTAIPIISLSFYLSNFGRIVLIFIVMIFLFSSLPLSYLDGKTWTDKANAYLALRKFLKEADL